jgi:LacI family transcriptional regulator
VGKQATTLYEVARHAGVSIATVSRVARGVDQVAPETKQKVLDAIEALNYRASHFGRALVNRRHDTLGIVTPGLGGPYFADVVQSFSEETLNARMSLLLLGTHLLGEADEQVLGLADRGDGLAIMGGTISPELLHRLKQLGLPLVLVAQERIHDIPAIRVDNITGTKALVRHLIDDHGFTRLAFLGWIQGNPDGIERWRAFVDAHRDAGLEPPAEPIPAPFSMNAGGEVIDRLLALDPLPDALVCGNDEMAVSVIGALKNRGIRVPEDIAVTGWDDIPVAELVSPPLTTVRQPTRELGRSAARMLLQRINGEADTPDDLILPAVRVLRESCGCPQPSPAGIGSHMRQAKGDMAGTIQA